MSRFFLIFVIVSLIVLPCDGFEISVDAVSSSTISLSWESVSDASEIRVLLAAEPAPNVGSTMPGAVVVATLDAGETSFDLEGLAPAVDHFISVEIDTPGGTEKAFAHALTPSGSLESLDTPLRRVHLLAPDVLLLVFCNQAYYNGTDFDGFTGDAWQGGVWTVMRSSGSPIPVTAVHRKSVPVSQPEYETGYGESVDNNVVIIDHSIFLVLSEAIGSRELLRITHGVAGKGTDFELTLAYSDTYLETPVVQLNQVGYCPRASRRWAYISGWMGDGGALDLSGFPSAVDVLIEPVDPLRSRRLILSGIQPQETTQRLLAHGNNAVDGDVGAEVREIDLSSLPASEGARYRIRVPGVGVSWPTAVSETAIFKSFFTIARGLFLNRWYGDLNAAYTDWSRPADHGVVYLADINNGPDMFDSANPPPVDRPLVLEGGHHDAGDFDIRPYHVLVAQYLMRAYEANAGAFTDGQLGIPESGNGVPDLLDEALWSIRAWEALQKADGSVRRGVESFRHPWGYYYADEDQLNYWTFNALGEHSAYCSGLFAQAANLVQPFDADRAAVLQQRAVDAYAHGFAESAPSEYLIYGAGELFRLTETPAYESDYTGYWDDIDAWGRGLFDHCKYAIDVYPGDFAGSDGSSGEHHAMADFAIAYAEAKGSGTIYDVTVAQLNERASVSTGLIIDSAHAHRSPREAFEGVYWGRGTSTGRFMDSIYQRMQMGGSTPELEQRYLDALSLAADYVLGANPPGMVMVTGLGSVSPKEPLHLDSLTFIKDGGFGPIPGIPVYGPVHEWPGSPYYDAAGAAFFPEFEAHPMMRRFAFTRPSVNMSEFSVWEIQAPLVELLGVLLAPGMEPPQNWLAGGSEHQNPLPPHSDPVDIFSDGFESGDLDLWSETTP